jgi:shikimate dehydrogenase
MQNHDLPNAIIGSTKLLGVIGDPIEHSLSPVMHNAALVAMGLDYIYVPFHIQPADLKCAIAGLAAIGVQGFNVTIPHKQTIMPLLADVTDVAKAIGAVNTVWRTEQGWIGTNTDVEGFLAPLRSLDRDWSDCEAVVLGNGGAARAIVAGCAQLGCANIWVVGRNSQRLEQFQQSWQSLPLASNLQVQRWENLPELLCHADLLINTTPIGMAPQIDASPVPAAWMASIHAAAIAYDLIYTPRPTRFLQQAQQQGALIYDGLEMLIHQGAAALKIWVQQAVPINIMSQSLQPHV